MVRKVNSQVRNGLWTQYPADLSQKAFLGWFLEFQEKFLRRGPGILHQSPNQSLASSDCQRKPDLFLALSYLSRGREKLNWADIGVIGEFKKSVIRGKSTEELINFSGLARELFAAQPTRRFLHGFFIRGSMMELWVFDRSGPYASEPFNIHTDPCRFVKIMFGYTRMTEEQLGMNPYFKEDRMGKFIEFRGEGKKKERFYLEDKPIVFRRAIMCRGTACYRAKKRDSKRWEHIVKFAWRSDKRQVEGELLKLARQRRVWGVAKLIYHQDLEEIADIRSGLQFNKPRTFPSPRRDDISQTHSGQSGMRADVLGTSLTLSATSSSRQRQKSTEEKVVAPSSQRSQWRGSKRPLSASSAAAQMDSAIAHADKKLRTNSLMAPDVPEDGLYDNRIFSCLVTSPLGRPLRWFKSVEEFLGVCRDVVKAHQSLYYKGKILHRDISANNIIITIPKQEGDPRGMLIDLDHGIQIDSGSSGARHRTGTMEFMAIDVLEGKKHTYRHDLESLLYVFLWEIIGYRQDGHHVLPGGSRLRDWYRGSYTQIANAKRGHMDKKAFRAMLDEFPTNFEGLKGLAEKLRDLLFPYVDGLFTGTYRESEKMYQPMIKAFQRAIAKRKRTISR